MATQGQIKVIQIYRRKQFSDDADYRDFLKANFGVTSSKKLSTREASEAIQLLTGDVPHPRTRSKYSGNGDSIYQRHLTQPQADRIGILEDLLGWHEGQTINFIGRQIGKKKAVSWLMKHEAVKVIVGMQRIIADGDQEYYNHINTLPNRELAKETVKEQQC